MSDQRETSQTVDFTLTLLRRLEAKLDRQMEIMLRFDERLGRVERDVHEVKSDLILIENRLLTHTSEILTVVRRLDEERPHEQAT